MNLYDKFETSPDLEKEGIEVSYGDSIFMLARAGGANKRFATRFQQLTKPFKREMDLDIFDEKKGQELLAQAFAETVVLGWQAVRDKEGNVMEFSVENCVKLLVDLPPLFADLRNMAADFTNYLAVERVEEGKA